LSERLYPAAAGAPLRDEPGWSPGIAASAPAPRRIVNPAPVRPPTSRGEAFAAHAEAAKAGLSQKRSYIRLIFLTDLLVVSIAILVGHLVRFKGAPSGTNVPYLLVGVGLGVAWLLCLYGSRCYDEHFLGYGPDEYRRVVGASLKLAGVIAIGAYLAELDVSRGFLAITFLIGATVLPVTRYVARRGLHRSRSREKGWTRRVLVVGDASHVIELSHQLRRDWYAGYQVVGACIPEALIAPVPQHLDGVPVVGSFRHILESAEAICADTVAVTGSAELTARRLRRLGWQMEGTGINLVLAPTLTDVAGPRIHTRPLAGLSLIHVESPEFRGARKALKGFVDRTAAFLALFLVAPLFVAIAIAIAINSKGPVFFRQTRVGLGGREFDLLKFRSMVPDADAMLSELAEYNESNGLMFKMRSDPRITKAGAFLRKWSLDELPQLVNVLKGDMSLVGPRPPLPSEVAWYDQDVARRLLVKPGMTGLWQVSGRSDLSWEDGIRLDLYYVENWSLATDVLILWKTAGAVIRRRGAY
jgi:exopolysaccharide biosynthesis polyprenyl glycosylphosphotransferase